MKYTVGWFMRFNRMVYPGIKLTCCGLVSNTNVERYSYIFKYCRYDVAYIVQCTIWYKLKTCHIQVKCHNRDSLILSHFSFLPREHSLHIRGGTIKVAAFTEPSTVPLFWVFSSVTFTATIHTNAVPAAHGDVSIRPRGQYRIGRAWEPLMGKEKST